MSDLRSVSLPIDFVKMQGLGNNYVYLTAMPPVAESDLPSLARTISSPNYGLGSDGMVLVLPSDRADFRMRIFNADGSEAEMCGNASRCICKLVYESGLTDRREITLETLGGIKRLHLQIEANQVTSVRVDMGRPMLVRELALAGREFVDVNVGNPHAVTFVDEITDAMLAEEGPFYEHHGAFPNRTNVEFAHVLDRRNIRMRVWERGSGETMACGTGACATAFAAMHLGLADNCVTIHLNGGDLLIEFDPQKDHLFMTGPAQYIARGTFFHSPENPSER